MNGKGFTLMEIIISVLIITILVAGMFGAFVGAQSIFIRGKHRMQALNFAREAQDRLRSGYDYNSSPQLDAGTDKPESDIGTIIRGEMVNSNAVLTYDVSDSQPVAGYYKKVEVKVTWDEGN